jgi:hypothetical protein
MEVVTVLISVTIGCVYAIERPGGKIHENKMWQSSFFKWHELKDQSKRHFSIHKSSTSTLPVHLLGSNLTKGKAMALGILVLWCPHCKKVSLLAFSIPDALFVQQSKL